MYVQTGLGLALALALAGCGGGDGDAATPSNPTPGASAAGFYTGTTSAGQELLTAVFQDGTYYSVYSSTPTSIGAIVGTGEARNGSFTSTDARDFHVGGIDPVTVSASYVSKQSIGGSVTYTSPARAVTFTGTYDASYESTPSLSTLAGSYSGAALNPSGAENANFTIAPNGSFTGNGTSGCTFSGTVKPKTAGNAYDVNITFGGAPCTYAALTLSGAAVLDRGDLIVVTTSTDKSRGMLFVGSGS